MMSGTTWPDGDPFLERQNEQTCAVSSRDPKKLLCGSNDYSTVQLGLLTDIVTGDAWLRYYTSRDGGGSWKSRLVPGCPYNTPDCHGSPVRQRNLQFGADPVVRAGSNGLFYYAFIAANRDQKDGLVAVARFIDDNNFDGAQDASIRYVDTEIVATSISPIP